MTFLADKQSSRSVPYSWSSVKNLMVFVVVQETPFALLPSIQLNNEYNMRAVSSDMFF